MIKHSDKLVSRSVRFIRQVLWDLATTVVPALLIALFINVYVAEAVVIDDGPSMQPNLYRGDQMMAEKVSYRFHPPQRGDVVIVTRPANEVSLVKRVVALPGETVTVRAGHTFIDDQPIDEPWVTHFGGPGYPPTLVPPDHVFVLGDNRANSRDSRAIGPVPISTLKGRVWLVYWPPDQIKLLP
ncbi:MAG: signal peptidase I [Chloroflexi bacterium]|nr:signal peptidase I [Chloroflexota bacterium]MBU1751594.1 signal peptidase I [Chloroflexota bacterium]MBU1877312.1 signal peptidase I [Chloroflexota bacterium]